MHFQPRHPGLVVSLICLVSMYVVFGDDLVVNARRPQTPRVRPQSALNISVVSSNSRSKLCMGYTIDGFCLGIPERADVK